MNSLESSIVIPCFNTHESLVELIERIDNSLPKTNFEVILVDDGSIDDTWAVIEATSKKNDKVEGIKLSRNFGQHKAIRAGLEKSKGLNIVVMDWMPQQSVSNATTHQIGLGWLLDGGHQCRQLIR